jgi:NADPH2:quinone reductase
VTAGSIERMRAWQVVRSGRPSHALELRDLAIPDPGPREVLVRATTTVLNYNEIDGCRGRYLTVDPPMPYTLGMELVGVVDRVGPGAESWLGRRVVATAVGAFGAHAEFVTAPIDMVFDAPDRLDDLEARGWACSPADTSRRARPSSSRQPPEASGPQPCNWPWRPARP